MTAKMLAFALLFASSVTTVLSAQTATPVITLASGTYAMPTSTTITDSTSGASILWCYKASTSSCTPATSYTAGTSININPSSIETICANATASSSVSATACQTYTNAGSSGSQTNTLPTSGNVGIGTTAPDRPLEVNGGIHLNMPGGINWSTNQSLLITNAVDSAAGDTGAQIWHGDGGAAGAHLLIFSAYPQTSSALTGGYIVLNTVSGNTGIGTTSPAYRLDVAGAIHSSGAVIASGGVTFPDGSTQTSAFNPTLCGGDYAESVDVSGGRTSYQAGDVLVIDPRSPGKFLKSSGPYSTLVTGVYSTKPGTVGRRQTTPQSPDEVPMAMIGIVPTKVSAENGPIKAGDLLVTASLPGYAMKGTDRSRMLGAVIGKALGSLDYETGVIEAVVTLQ